MAATMRGFVIARKIFKPVPLFRSFVSETSLWANKNQNNVEIPKISKNEDAFASFLKVIKNKKLRQGLTNEVPESLGPIKTTHVTKETRARNSNWVKKFKSDEDCDKIIRDDLNESFDKALESLKYYDKANRYPSQKTCFTLLRISLINLNPKATENIRQIIKTAYPQEFKWQMGYEHYIAEYHWKIGDYSKAMEIFDKLFSMYNQRRKKLSDMLQFMARKIINEESEDEVKNLIQFVISLINKYSTHHPATNVWLLLFLSEKGTNHILSNTLLGIKPDKMAPFVLNKIETILKHAKEKGDIDCVQRMVECVLFLQAKSEYTKVFSTLLEIQCIIGDLKSAQETFKYCNSEAISLSGTAISEYAKLVKPTVVKTQPKTAEFEFRFKF